jgi:hypothetical protein
MVHPSVVRQNRSRLGSWLAKIQNSTPSRSAQIQEFQKYCDRRVRADSRQ